MPPKEEFIVTPYEVRGTIDYDRLAELFGTQPVTPELLERLGSAAGGPLPPVLRRGVYRSHRDLPELLDRFGRGERFFLYSGRGPSGPMHIAHLIPFDLCRWFQERFRVPMYVQITDDEKFWLRPGTGREETARWGFENLLDILAVGFDPARTRVFFDGRSIGTMYPLATEVAKRIPYSTVKAVFGFKPSVNVGLVFYTALQSVPALYPSWRAGRSVPCLIPCGVDQDPHFRITRDLAESLGYPKPALLHNEIVPGLLGAKMSSGEGRDNALFLDDPPKEVERKLRKAFTGGRATVEEQRRLGAVPEICSIWAMWRTKFAPDEAEFDRLTSDCRSGALLCGECKSRLIERVEPFLRSHGERREKAREYAESLILSGPPHPGGPGHGPPIPEP